MATTFPLTQHQTNASVITPTISVSRVASGATPRPLRDCGMFSRVPHLPTLHLPLAIPFPRPGQRSRPGREERVPQHVGNARKSGEKGRDHSTRSQPPYLRLALTVFFGAPFWRWKARGELQTPAQRFRRRRIDEIHQTTRLTQPAHHASGSVRGGQKRVEVGLVGGPETLDRQRHPMRRERPAAGEGRIQAGGRGLEREGIFLEFTLRIEEKGRPGDQGDAPVLLPREHGAVQALPPLGDGALRLTGVVTAKPQVRASSPKAWSRVS